MRPTARKIYAELHALKAEALAMHDTLAAPLAQPPNMNVRKYIAAAVLSLEAIARGATIVVPMSEDTTLTEFNPTFNMGATTLGAGGLGLNASGARMRALMRFELVGIPAGATV